MIKYRIAWTRQDRLGNIDRGYGDPIYTTAEEALRIAGRNDEEADEIGLRSGVKIRHWVQPVEVDE